MYYTLKLESIVLQNVGKLLILLFPTKKLIHAIRTTKTRREAAALLGIGWKLFQRRLGSIRYSLPFIPHASTGVPNVTSRKVIHRPSVDELRNMLEYTPLSTIATDFGVSDTAVRKWCKSYGIKTKPRGYWQKTKAGK